MTKILDAVCNSVAVVLSTIFLPVRILMLIVFGIIEFPVIMFGTRFETGAAKEYFSMLFNGITMGLKDWWYAITVLYAKD